MYESLEDVFIEFYCNFHSKAALVSSEIEYNSTTHPYKIL